MLQKTRNEKVEIESMNTINNPFSTLLLRALIINENVEISPSVVEKRSTISNNIFIS
jgi:hypothetical protein